MAGLLNKVEMIKQSLQATQAMDDLQTARKALDEQLQKLSSHPRSV
jgi:hypothetical protein